MIHPIFPAVAWAEGEITVHVQIPLVCIYVDSQLHLEQLFS